MDPSVEDVGGGAAWRTGIVGEAGTGDVEAAGGEAGAGCSGGGNVEEVQVRVEGEEDC